MKAQMGKGRSLKNNRIVKSPSKRGKHRPSEGGSEGRESRVSTPVGGTSDSVSGLTRV